MTFYFDLLKSDIPNHLPFKLFQDIKVKGAVPSFTWSTTGASTVFKVMCSSTVLARWICANLVDFAAIWKLGLHACLSPTWLFPMKC